MSEHEWVRENLDAYVAGALPAAELVRVAQHVADCADCKEALTCAQKMETTMAELFADARPDAKLEDRMIRGLRKVRVPFRWSMWIRFAAGAAAMVMLGVVGAIVQAVAAGGSFQEA
jgi:anti-sigma factor RsiW